MCDCINLQQSKITYNLRVNICTHSFFIFAVLWPGVHIGKICQIVIICRAVPGTSHVRFLWLMTVKPVIPRPYIIFMQEYRVAADSFQIFKELRLCDLIFKIQIYGRKHSSNQLLMGQLCLFFSFSFFISINLPPYQLIPDFQSFSLTLFLLLLLPLPYFSLYVSWQIPLGTLLMCKAKLLMGLYVRRHIFWRL